jgi:hypothetical protein
MIKLLKMLKKTADNIAATMLAAMFVTFLLQIVSRYLFNLSLSWTVEVCLTLWLWLVLWASAFCASESDHIRFDMLYIFFYSHIGLHLVLQDQKESCVTDTASLCVQYLWGFHPGDCLSLSLETMDTYLPVTS